MKRLVMVLLIAPPALLLAWCGEGVWAWPYRALPPGLPIESVLARDSDHTGCSAAVYQLAPATISALQKGGVAYLRTVGRPADDNPDNRYGAWQETPGFIDMKRNGQGAAHTVFGLYATGGCHNDDAGFRSTDIEKAISAPGSFYMVTSNDEGIVVVAPQAGLAASYYFG